MKILIGEFLCSSLRPLLPCWSSPPLEDALFRNIESPCLDDEQSRVRRRYTSSPRATPAVDVFSPAITPISVLLGGKYFNYRPSVSLNDKQDSLPEISEYSRFNFSKLVSHCFDWWHIIRILSSLQTVQMSQSLPARSRLESWQQVYSLSRDGSSLYSLTDKLKACDSNVLFVIQVYVQHVGRSSTQQPIKMRNYPILNRVLGEGKVTKSSHFTCWDISRVLDNIIHHLI